MSDNPELSVTNDVRLSIAIPTYNRAVFLPDLLQSIEREWADGIEVVICDNASTDGTDALLEEWRSRLPRVTIIRHAENIGPDRNFLAVVAASSAPFCWLVGSDDVLEHGAIATMLRVLDEQPAIVGASVNYTPRSSDMVRALPAVHYEDFATTRFLFGAGSVFGQIGHHLGFLSGQVVRRSLWLEAADDPCISQFMNGYIHVYLIGQMLGTDGAWLVMADRLVGWRTGNDSFLVNGRWRRMQIDVEGYGAIGTALFGQGSPVETKFRNNVASVHIFYALLSMRLQNDWSFDTRRNTRLLLYKNYHRYVVYYRILLPLLYLPNPIIGIAKFTRSIITRFNIMR